MTYISERQQTHEELAETVGELEELDELDEIEQFILLKYLIDFIFDDDDNHYNDMLFHMMLDDFLNDTSISNTTLDHMILFNTMRSITYSRNRNSGLSLAETLYIVQSSSR